MSRVIPRARRSLPSRRVTCVPRAESAKGTGVAVTTRPSSSTGSWPTAGAAPHAPRTKVQAKACPNERTRMCCLLSHPRGTAMAGGVTGACDVARGLCTLPKEAKDERGPIRSPGSRPGHPPSQNPRVPVASWMAVIALRVARVLSQWRGRAGFSPASGLICPSNCEERVNRLAGTLQGDGDRLRPYAPDSLGS